MSNDELIAELTQQAQTTRTLVQDLSAAQLTERRADGHWSVQEVVGHLRDAATLFAGRFERIVAGTADDEQYFGADRLVEGGNYNALSLVDMWDEWAAKDRETGGWLHNLPDEAWQRTGSHLQRGPITLASEVGHYVAHQQGHIDEISTRVSMVREGAQ